MLLWWFLYHDYLVYFLAIILRISKKPMAMVDKWKTSPSLSIYSLYVVFKGPLKIRKIQKDFKSLI